VELAWKRGSFRREITSARGTGCQIDGLRLEQIIVEDQITCDSAVVQVRAQLVTSSKMVREMCRFRNGDEVHMGSPLTSRVAGQG